MNRAVAIERLLIAFARGAHPLLPMVLCLELTGRGFTAPEGLVYRAAEAGRHRRAAAASERELPRPVPTEERQEHLQQRRHAGS